MKITYLNLLILFVLSTTSNVMHAEETNPEPEITRALSSSCCANFFEPQLSLSNAEDVTGILAVVHGGTGQNSLTNHAVLVGQAGSPVAFAAPSTAGVPLVSTGASSNPAFGTALVAGGGTGATSLAAYAILAGGTTTTGTVQTIAPGATNTILASTGTASLSSFKTLSTNIVIFLESPEEPYYPSTGTVFYVVECLGAGGGGGGCGTQDGYIAAGGGSGGYSRSIVTASGNSGLEITVGRGGLGGLGNFAGLQGGNSSLEGLVTALGGMGGGAGATTAVQGGAGGDIGTGQITLAGYAGQSTSGLTALGTLSGAGASSIYGPGGYSITQLASNKTNGNAGLALGSGGSGATAGVIANSDAHGGNGVDGIVIITEYILS